MLRHPHIHDRNRRALILPRLVAGGSRASAFWNAVGLLVTALIGVGLVHLLAYHVPLDVPLGPRWIVTARDLLVHCPLVGPLGAIFAIAVLASLLACREVLRLKHLNAALFDRVAARRLPLPPSREALPRSPWRLGALVLTLLGLQSALFALAGTICPMQGSMVMHGVSMVMPMAPALPLGPLHLVVAVTLALLLWRVEHRLTRLRAQIARQLRLLGRYHIAARAPLPLPRAARRPLDWQGSALFARPPPSAL